MSIRCMTISGNVLTLMNSLGFSLHVIEFVLIYYVLTLKTQNLLNVYM